MLQHSFKQQSLHTSKRKKGSFISQLDLKLPLSLVNYDDTSIKIGMIIGSRSVRSKKNVLSSVLRRSFQSSTVPSLCSIILLIVRVAKRSAVRIKSPESLTYTKPRLTILGPDKICLFFLLIVVTTMSNPLLESLLRSPRISLSTLLTTRPSTNTFPDATLAPS